MTVTASGSQEDMMGIFIQTIRQEFQKALPQTIQNSSNSRSNSTDSRSVRFISPGLNRHSAITNTKSKLTKFKQQQKMQKQSKH